MAIHMMFIIFLSNHIISSIYIWFRIIHWQIFVLVSFITTICTIPSTPTARPSNLSGFPFHETLESLEPYIDSSTTQPTTMQLYGWESTGLMDFRNPTHPTQLISGDAIPTFSTSPLSKSQQRRDDARLARHTSQHVGWMRWYWSPVVELQCIDFAGTSPEPAFGATCRRFLFPISHSTPVQITSAPPQHHITSSARRA